MSEQEVIKLFEHIRENIQQTQRKLYERKAKLGESVIIADSKGQPISVSAEEVLRRINEGE